jgi:hypothetical protein
MGIIMKKIVFYELFILAGIACALVFTFTWEIPRSYALPALCVLAGGIGGCVYCLRGVYLNYSAKKQWTKEWEPWYFIRPIVSMVCGGVSFVFLKAGLLMLESKPTSDSSQLGFLALAFVAGLNVDRFLAKVEDISQVAWGIEKSRAQDRDDSAK